ncbi:hypothetical protein N1851_028716 [Merluccius polli]|uniref:Uncharacterized protein n=1 Tax=Merluccius polli TaxID=89951 RepID=A0AA47M854_MERPO|nr:hypothetical protein N1851_028716 [Merluccius polli]
MTYRYISDPKHPHYKEGRRKAVEIDFDHTLAEARRASEERKRARSGGVPPQISKRVSAGRGKPWGRRGGRRRASASVACPAEYSISSSVEVPGTEPSAQLNPQEEFEKIRRGSILSWPHVPLLTLKEALRPHGLFGSGGKKQDHTT